MRLAHTAAAGVVTLLAFAAPAHAGRVESTETCPGPHGFCQTIVSFTAAPRGDERHHRHAGGERGCGCTTPGAPVDAGPKCAQHGDHEVLCDDNAIAFV